MAEQINTRDTKLIQYLNEAYGKEKELETALAAHIKMANERATYKKRLQDHLKETKAQAKGLERRIKQLGGKAEAVTLPGPEVASEVASRATAAASKAVAAAKGPVHLLRGTGTAEKLLKNVKTELWNEYEEIGNYVAIEALAKAVGDKDTEKLAREFRKQEERMAAFLTTLLPQLGKAVANEEIPVAERRSANGGRRRSKPAKSRASSRSTSRSTSSRSTSSRSKPATSSRSSSSRTKASSSRTKSAKSSRSSSSRSKPAKSSRSSSSRTKASSSRTKSAKSSSSRRTKAARS